MIRLDKQVPNDPKQLNLFSPKSDTHTGIKNETQQVPILTDTSTDFDTAQVPNMGHLIKPNNKQERETPTHKIFKKNKKIQNAINDMAQVPKSVHMPALTEVEKFFTDTNYPIAEAKKFYNHYKAIGWKIQGVTPIEDWKALVEKWMENSKKWEDRSPLSARRGVGGEADPVKDIQYLFESYLEGKKIFHHITTDHFTQLKLKLELNEETIQQAWHERTNQLSGTNQNSIIKLWEAYLSNNPNNELVLNDKPNLIALVKRIAVINHFNNLKKQSQ